ncbi:thiamine biosynthesis protein ThiI [Amylolactobacillus amylotrophicus DSM 20534]|uniref:tRNA 4-thiouridine(8) synthase ThiI n=3 Tax=Amylolactobacillus TaxID=2767876 RepID=A0A1L6XDN4_9LACO|nr:MULTISPECIES: tRNA uracil 4-sulfurtransferase ThiI [Amylolactobacillus]APT19086.1 tRNA 4-thiouridine(8) synthase ThiI [Amylolactobacillus amylophilus DSM 20533 = JCM 1125]KRK38648.1 thiamine biosynthesis protein ThiI [Amylolactobacillus amylotrophicus DSM 20534]KRM42709.1 thiamine biosynthesis protein ThiI [Amylolactobacillus amylophilus DSM 20533 = JCM 1125]GED79570.1 putative tRNA sulfurtransferase [Amylolactobacillus amylophilus]
MEYTEIMVRYGELSTKGKNRKDFIGRLNGNVTKALRAYKDTINIQPKRDRMHIILNGAPFDEIDHILGKVFGIQTYSPAIRIERDIELVKQTALELMQATYEPGMTYKVNTRRSDHGYEYDTNQMNLLIGDYLSEQMPEMKVQMRNADLVLRIEVRHDAIYLSNQLIHGAGGLPVGTAGKGVMMLSGGIDSPVASYLAMKRGVEIEMVHFFSPPYTTKKALAKAQELTGKLANYSGKINFIAVPFAEIQETIKANVPEGYLMTIQRRFMLRLTDIIRDQREALAIFNGEAIGQVASQTLESMAAINDVTNTPILRPVATMDKTEIIKIAEEIDTFDLSVMPFEDCCTIFAPPRPKTRPNLDKARHYEQMLDVTGLIERALSGIEITPVYPEQQFLNDEEDFATSLL